MTPMKNLIMEIVERVFHGPIPEGLRPDEIFSRLSIAITQLEEDLPDVVQIISFNLVGETVNVVYINDDSIEVEEPLWRFTQ